MLCILFQQQAACQIGHDDSIRPLWPETAFFEFPLWIASLIFKPENEESFHL